MTITHIETNQGMLTKAEAIAKASRNESLNAGWSQIVMGVYENGSKTSLKWKGDGFYFMSGNFCEEPPGHSHSPLPCDKSGRDPFPTNTERASDGIHRSV